MFDSPNQGIQGVAFFQSNPIDPSTLVAVLLGLTLFIALLIYATYRYRRFKKMAEFHDELSQLGLESAEEDALTSLVKKHALDEPVDVLMSLRSFDELAQKEMALVLGSAGSSPAKEKYITMVYDIRRKTYYPELCQRQVIDDAMAIYMGTDTEAVSENTSNTEKTQKNAKTGINLSAPVSAS